MTHEDYLQALPEGQKQFVTELIQELSEIHGASITPMRMVAICVSGLAKMVGCCSLCTGKARMRHISVAALLKPSI